MKHFDNRKPSTHVLAWILATVMLATSLLAVLPVTAVATAAEDTYTGFTMRDTGYESDWVGSTVVSAAWASWLQADGQYSGAWMWSPTIPSSATLTYDSTLGTLTFKNFEDPFLKFCPGENAAKSLGEGPCYLSFELYYESGTYTSNGETMPKFSGVDFSYRASGINSTFFTVDTDGAMRVGNDTEVVKTLSEGWNRIELVLLPMDASGNIVESTNDATYGSTDWPIKKTDVYVRAEKVTQMSKTRAFDYTDLNASWHKIENFQSGDRFYGGWYDSSKPTLGYSSYLKPYLAGNGSFSIRNSSAYNLNVNDEFYKVTYEGYPALTQGLPTDAVKRRLVSPRMNDGVFRKWYDEVTDTYLTPGDEFPVATSIHYIPLDRSLDGNPFGLALKDAGYESDWVGSRVIKASYGAWIATDGQYNGAWMWWYLSGRDQATYDSVEGTLTFTEADDPYLKFFPGQISNNPLREGPCYLSFELYYESGTYESEGETVPKFSGVDFSYSPSSAYAPFFSIDTDGTVYIGESIIYNPNATPVDTLDEGWNRIELVLLPQDADGNVLEGANGIPYYAYEDQNGNGAYDNNEPRTKNPDWPVKSTDVYIRAGGVDTATETRAFDYADLNAAWHKLENFIKGDLFYGGGSVSSSSLNATPIGQSTYLRPVNSGKGSFSIRNSSAYNLNVSEEFYKVTYEGYPELSQGVAVNSSRQELTVPSAVKNDYNEPVNFWYNEWTDTFLKPGDTFHLTESCQYAVAEGGEESRGALKAAIDRVRTDDLESYTYAELVVERENLWEVSIEACLPSDHEYEVIKEEVIVMIEDRMACIEDACLLLIDRSYIICDENEDLADRIYAYTEASDYSYDWDATYSSEAAEAIEAVTAFEQLWFAVEDDYLTYMNLIVDAEIAEDGTEKNLIYTELASSFYNIAMAFQTFECDDSVTNDYIANMTYMKALYDDLDTLEEKYTFLCDWVNSWNDNSRSFWGYSARTMSAPDELLAAVRDYNEEVRRFNQNMLNAMIAAGGTQTSATATDTAESMLADAQSKLNNLYNEANGN